MSDRTGDLARIEEALGRACDALRPYVPGDVAYTFKSGDDPVTEADLAVDEVLRSSLLRRGEGWLSEETVDDESRLAASRVWVVDPLDGTREFVRGIPEWCVSVGLVEDGLPVAGGVVNPAAGHLILGAPGLGVSLDGGTAAATDRRRLPGALVLASRSEVARHEWDAFFRTDISVRNMGSVAYKLALVGAGLADATWTLVPKHEWDVAAGCAIAAAGGATVAAGDATPLRFNRPHPLFPSVVGVTAPLAPAVFDLIATVTAQE